MFCVFVFLVSLFPVLNECFGRSSKSGTFDNLKPVSSAYSAVCLSSLAGDITDFPQEPFRNSCSLSRGRGIARRVAHTGEIRTLFLCHRILHVETGNLDESTNYVGGLEHQSPGVHTVIMVSTTYWMSSVCLCCNCHSEVQVFSLSFYMCVNWSTEVKWSVDVATGPECKFRLLMLTPLVFVLRCTTLPTHTYKSFSFFLQKKKKHTK